MLSIADIKDALLLIWENQDSSNICSKDIKNALVLLENLSEPLTPKQLDSLLLNDVIASLPNVPHESVPPGKAIGNNVLVEEVPSKEKNFISRILDVLSIPWSESERQGLGPYPKSLVERRLEMLALDTVDSSFVEYHVPCLVNSEALRRSAHLPKFKDGMHKLSSRDLWMLPTVEVALLAISRHKPKRTAPRPFRSVAASQCFRREVGSGAESVHRKSQYRQVEVLSICSPLQALDELSFLVRSAQEPLKKLGLRHRVVEVCHGQLPLSAAKAYKIEAWLPRSKNWLDVSTVSYSADFLTRRNGLEMQCEGSSLLPHCVSGSIMACTRVAEVVQECAESLPTPLVIADKEG